MRLLFVLDAILSFVVAIASSRIIWRRGQAMVRA